MNVQRKCDVCGRIFIAHVHNKKYCSPECQKIGFKRKHDEYNLTTRAIYDKGLMDDIMNDVRTPFKNNSRLVQNNTMARLLGVDYGIYMAMREGRLPMKGVQS